METAVITYRQALDSYADLAKSFEDSQPLDTDKARVLAYAVKNNVQMRDYLLGDLPEDSVTFALGFCEAVLPIIDEADRAPFYTLMSAFHYEQGDKELATASLIEAERIDPEYPLSVLLARVYNAGLPQTFLSLMRVNLHEKVRAIIVSNFDNSITE